MGRWKGRSPALPHLPRPLGWQADNDACHSKPDLSLSRFEISAWGLRIGEELRELLHGDGVLSRHWAVQQYPGTGCGPQVDTASCHQILNLHGGNPDLKLEMGCRHPDHEGHDRKTGDYCHLRHYHHAHGKLHEQVDRGHCRAAQRR